MEITVRPGHVGGRVSPPCSKSYAQRALAASLLAEGRSVLHNLEFCDDTLSAMRCIETLGARITRLDETTLAIEGGIRPSGGVQDDIRPADERRGGLLRPASDTLHTGESGLATRLFTPIAALCDRPMRIVGTGSLLHRPMGPMIDTLRRLGAEITDNDGRLPLTVRGPLHGGEATIDGSISSQFVTGLLLTLPLVPNDTVLHITEPVSIPYLDMTVDTAARFGIEIGHRDYIEFFIEGGQRFRASEFFIEGDWSAAAMLLAAGAVAGETTVENVRMLSKQADTAVCEALVRAGASVISDANSVTAEARPLQAFEFDATHCPDLFPALAALAATAEGTSTLRGTSRLVSKECDRATAIREEYGKLGIEVELAEPDTMRIRGGTIRGGRVQSHGDHRMAMSLAVAALRADGPVVIDGAECVAKSFPDFFEVLDRMKLKR